jgi:hypothetical protein
LTQAIIDLAAAHLKRQFLFQTQRNRFASVDGLRELAVSAHGCVKPSLASGRVTGSCGNAPTILVLDRPGFRISRHSPNGCARRCRAPSIF